MYVCVYVCMYVCMCVCVYVCMYVCMDVQIFYRFIKDDTCFSHFLTSWCAIFTLICQSFACKMNGYLARYLPTTLAQFLSSNFWLVFLVSGNYLWDNPQIIYGIFFKRYCALYKSDLVKIGTKILKLMGKYSFTILAKPFMWKFFFPPLWLCHSGRENPIPNSLQMRNSSIPGGRAC